MRTSQAGLDLIKHSEGLRVTPYLDVAGFWTVGYGHKMWAAEIDAGGTRRWITEAEADTLLVADLETAEQAVARLVKVPLTQGQFDALVDFTFNLGAGRLQSSTLLKDINAGKYNDAAEQLLLWDHASGKELPALKTRREEEYKLWKE
jgi:lysozyme